MKRLVAALVAAAACLSIGAGSVLAVIPGTLDAKQESTTGLGDGWGVDAYLAQTWTAEHSGNLTAISVYLGLTPVEVPGVAGVHANATPDPNVAIEFTGASGGLPTGTIVDGGAALGTFAPGWVTLLLSPPSPVVAGQQYGIFIESNTGWDVTWSGVCGSDPYAGGEALVKDTSLSSPAWQTMSSWATAHDSLSACQNDFAFRTYIQGAGTPPPTSTFSESTPAGTPSVPWFLAFAGLAAAAAFVTVKRIESLRR